MTVKGMHGNSNTNNKPSVFTLEETSFNNISPNSGSPSRDVNLNHLSIVNPSQRSPSHNKGFSPSSSPTREVPETQLSQKSIVHLKEKKEDRYVIESTIEMTKNDEFVLKSPEKESLKDVISKKFHNFFNFINFLNYYSCTRVMLMLKKI